jgi:hypothetical protein
MCVKKEKVGATHLFLVSRRKYPQSIRNAVKRIGPSVRLLQLNDLETGNWPISIVNNCIYYYNWQPLSFTHGGFKKKYSGKIIDPIELHPSTNKLFRLEHYDKTFSVNDLINIHISNLNTIFFNEGKIELHVHFPYPNQRIWLHNEKNYVELSSLYFDVVINMNKVEYPLKFKGYKPVNESYKAWVSESTVISSNDKEVTLRMTYKLIDENTFRVVSWNTPDNMIFDLCKL